MTMFYVKSASFQEKQKTIVRRIVRLTEHIFEKHFFQILTQQFFFHLSLEILKILKRLTF